MDKEALQTRLAALQAAKQESVNLIVTLDGAIAECLYWLSTFSETGQETVEAGEANGS